VGRALARLPRARIAAMKVEGLILLIVELASSKVRAV
jgi:hypothetical protein